MNLSRSFLVLLAVLLLAFALRMFRLDFFSLRGDEAFTVLFVQKPLAQMWHETLTVEPNPPLLYFALRGWIALAGDGEFATRFFSAFFGMLCVPLLYRLAREIFDLTPNPSPGRRGESIGLVAAFLIAINPYQIWHSQDVRNYTLWPALSLLALVFFWQWYRRGEPAKLKREDKHEALPLLFFTIAELFALYAHYYEAFILLALNVFVFATMWRDLKKLAQWIAAQVVLALLYLPYPLILSNRVSAYGEGSGRQGVALWDVARETFSAFVLGDTLDATWCAWLWIPFALLALASLVYLFTRDWRRGLFFALYAGIPTLAVFALNVVRPLYLERYLNGIAPAFYLLLAYGIAASAEAIGARTRLPHARRAVLALAAVVFAALAFLTLQNYWTQPAYAKAPDWRGLTRIINAHAQPGDLIVQNFPEMSLLYYDRTRLPLVVYPETFLPDTKTAQQLNAVNANYQRVWFIPAAPDFWDPEHYVEQWLDRRGDLLNEWRAGDFRLRLYATASQYLNTMQRLNRTYGDTFLLQGYRTERLGDTLRVVLFWRAAATPQTEYVMRIETADAQGNVLTRSESIPVRGAVPTTQWRKNQSLVDPHQVTLPTGATQFRVRVCEINTETCLPITDPATPEPRAFLPIP
jgi:uncharacterized membrane protein